MINGFAYGRGSRGGVCECAHSFLVIRPDFTDMFHEYVDAIYRSVDVELIFVSIDPNRSLYIYIYIYLLEVHLNAQTIAYGSAQRLLVI